MTSQDGIYDVQLHKSFIKQSNIMMQIQIGDLRSRTFGKEKRQSMRYNLRHYDSNEAKQSA